MIDFKPDDFKPAWWQLKKPIIPSRVVDSILIICIIGLFTCAMVFLVNHHMYEARKSSKKSQEISMSEPKIKGKDTLPAIYAFSGTLGLLILLRVFNVTELAKDDIHDKHT
jgi:hypothetical protein